MKETALAISAWRSPAWVVVAFTLWLLPVRAHASDVPDPSAPPLHYAMNGNFDRGGNYLPGRAGFNLADVSNVGQLRSLGAGEKALVWIGQCNGTDERFRNAIQPFVGHPEVYGFFLMDDPDPRGVLSSCTPDNLKAESDWIHGLMPGAKTFIVLMNLSTSTTPSYDQTYNAANSHIDLFGIDPYPCRTELPDCDYDMIDRYVAAAASWGIPYSQMVPVYQSFGGGDWKDGDGGKYLMPSVEQTTNMLARWKEHVAAPEFDAVYSWGSQRSDVALGSELDLQDVFSAHNRASQ